MTRILSMARLALPTVFFGYAVFANLVIVTGPHPDIGLPAKGVLSGGLTINLDSLYKDRLPHMDPSSSLVGAARYAMLNEARHGAVVGQSGWLFSAEEVRPLPTPDQWDRAIATVLDLEAQIVRGGAVLIVVPLPAKIDVARSRGADAAMADVMAGLYADFARSLTAEGIPVVTARAELLASETPAFFATDTHWTQHGADVVAQAIAASGTISPGRLIYDRVAQSPTAFTGDLVRFVTAAAMAPGLGLMPETVRPVVQTPVSASVDIFGGADRDIVLVGTSYSANADWGFADALMYRLGRDVVSVAQEGLGPVQPMRDYLASPDYHAAPPTVVIWEIPVRYLTDPAVWLHTDAPTPEISASLHKENADG